VARLRGTAVSALEVLYVDNHLLAVAKPAGLPSVPDASGDESLLECARAWVEREFAKPGAAFLGVVQRLDRPVSGVLLFARTSKAAARLSEQFRARRVRKLYLAVGQGAPAPALGDAGELEQWLQKDEARNVVEVVPAGTPGARRACTRWRVLARAGAHTRFELEPLSGRAHQLRRAAASLGCPLLGDLKYGSREALADKSVALHAHAIELEHPTRGERLRFTARAPGLACWDFAACRQA